MSTLRIGDSKAIASVVTLLLTLVTTSHDPRMFKAATVYHALNPKP